MSSQTLPSYFFTITKKIDTFEGTDYFVGTNGFSIIEFLNDRNNIISEFTVCFDDISDLLFEEYEIDKYFQYIGTQYYLTIFSEKENKIIFSIADKYIKTIYDDQRMFVENIMNSWYGYKFRKDFKKIPSTFNLIKIKKGIIENVWLSNVKVTSDRLILGEKEFLFSEIRDIAFDGYGFKVEHKNYQIERKNIFFSKEIGDSAYIQLSDYGNSNFVYKYFIWLISTYGLHKE